MSTARGGRPIVWFVRHCESVWNEAGIVQGQAEAPGLTAAGRAQALALADRLGRCGATLVVSSDLARAIETATPIAERLGVALVTDPALRERNFGSAEGGPPSALGPARTGFGEAGVLDADARPPGGESVRELYQRVAGCLERFRIEPPSPCFVAVTHGGFLRVARNCLDGIPVEEMTPSPTPNGVVWRADLSTGELSLDPDPSFGEPS